MVLSRSIRVSSSKLGLKFSPEKRLKVSMVLSKICKRVSRAIHKGLRMSSNKIRRMIRLLTGKTYEDALRLLEFLPYVACAFPLNFLWLVASMPLPVLAPLAYLPLHPLGTVSFSRSTH